MVEIPISALNHYDYCPLRCWHIHVAGVYEENVYTVEGSLQHRRAHAGGTSVRDGVRQRRGVALYSDRLGLIGVADLVEEGGGEVWPVEQKRGRRGDWRNDRLQLCAQALCLEEMLGVEVRRGYIFYAGTGRREEVALDEALRRNTEDVVRAVRRLLETGERPDILYHNRCRGCSLEPICLPRERERLRAFRTASSQPLISSGD